MSLTQILDSIKDKNIAQIIAIAGDGNLIDNSTTSSDFREYLAHISSPQIEKYCRECLETKFEQRGYVLQDIVNQIGRRLRFRVIDGLYRGKTNSVGFDGLWIAADGRQLVIEVKTTDAYQIDLDKLANYRKQLAETGQISLHRSSILLVVGTQDTRGLEAQIRGSRHAWDIRLISVDALVKLLKLKETVDNLDAFHAKICDILTPQEFTKVDSIINIVFSTAEEIDHDASSDDDIADNEESGTQEKQPVSFYDQCIERISTKLQRRQLVKQGRTIYTSPEQDLAVSLAISREYRYKGRSEYWFAFHPAQKIQLENASVAFASFGCGSPDNTFLFPLDDLLSWLPGLNQTPKGERSYWHIRITEQNSTWILKRKPGFKDIDITSYLV